MSETEILDEIARRVADEPECLDMLDWHCGTVHCLAGHAQDIAGDMEADPQSEGLRLIPSAAHLFFAPTWYVRSWLACGRQTGAPLHEALRAIGVTVIRGGTVQGWSEGLLYIEQSTSTGQSGGEVWLYDQSASTGQSGGEVWLHGQSTSTGQSGGKVR